MTLTRRALLCATLAVTQPSQASVPQVLRVADTQSYDYPTVQALLHMDRELRSRTKRRLALQVFPSAQLGEEEDAIQQARIGAVHLTRVSLASLAGLAPLCGLFSAPNLIRSDAQLSRVLDSDVASAVLAQCELHGLVGLALYEAGPRSIYNRVRPVFAPGDMRGLRIRTQQSPLAEQTIAALGASPVALPYSQLLPALQAELVDGADNNWPSYVSTDQHRAAPFVTLTEHARPPEAVLISRKVWDALPPADRDALREAAQSSRAFHRVRFAEWSDIVRAQARAEGVQVVDDFDAEAFERLWRPMREAALADADLRRLAARVRDMA